MGKNENFVWVVRNDFYLDVESIMIFSTKVSADAWVSAQKERDKNQWIEGYRKPDYIIGKRPIME